MKQRIFARQLRTNATDAEGRLWQHLRDRQMAGQKFRRQAPMDRFVVDFVSYEQRLIIELDGGQHAESASDQARDQHLQALGYRVMRFWNNDVLENTEGVLEAIRLACEKGDGV